MSRNFLLISLTGLVALILSCINIGVGIFHLRPESTATLPLLRTQSTKSITVTRTTEPIPRPPLHTIVHKEWNITGDASWLLNYAIVGFPKCGTSTLMFHLQNHSQVQMFGDERCDVAYDQQAKLIRDLYTKLKSGPQYVRMIKCPMLLESTKLGMRNYQKWFNKTDMIVGIRHPVLWFESFYNFRIHNEFPMPPPGTLIGKCKRGSFNVCTFRSSFHIFLSNLGKTPMTPDELIYIDPIYHKAMDPVPAHQAVLLYEVTQLSEPSFRIDLQSFLQLEQPVDPLIWYTPGRDHTDERLLQKIKDLQIDICSNEHDELRQSLQATAINASRWIRRFFVKAPGVFVSSPRSFDSLLKGWETDPCTRRPI